jgi:hypothetical protein
MKRILMSVCLVVVTCAAAWAGDPAKKTAAKGTDAMMAEMAKCTVCKNMVSVLPEVGPIQTDVVRLNNGAAIMHTVSPAKADVYLKAHAATAKAGEACATMTDEQAKAQLCGFCQEIRGVMKAGASMSTGTTKNGDLMVLTSNDPAVQARIAGLASKCDMMSANTQAAR